MGGEEGSGDLKKEVGSCFGRQQGAVKACGPLPPAEPSPLSTGLGVSGFYFL